jgi:glutaredoxin 3
MAKVLVYTMNYCSYCEAAKRLLKGKGIAFEEILVADDDDATWKRLQKETGYRTMPQIFIGDRFVGGYVQLAALERNGELDALVKKP